MIADRRASNYPFGRATGCARGNLVHLPIPEFAASAAGMNGDDSLVDARTRLLRERLEAIAKRRNLKKKQWARMARLSERTLGHFLSGYANTITHRTLEKLATAAGTTMDVLMGHSPDPLDPLAGGYGAASDVAQEPIRQEGAAMPRSAPTKVGARNPAPGRAPDDDRSNETGALARLAEAQERMADALERLIKKLDDKTD